MKKYLYIPAAIFIAHLLMFVGCKSKDHKTRHTITTGQPVNLLNERVGNSGILYVEKPDDSLNGLLMFVPDQAFASSRKFNISYAPITSHDLGSDFNPISPLITISCGGGLSDSIVTMEIPIRLQPGQFAMGFLYDENTGQLEGMPILKLVEDRIVIALRNFSHSTSKKSSSLTAKFGGEIDEEVARFVISAVTEKKLLEPYDSGFEPGKDDCAAKNYGSMLYPEGHCSGQVQLMMWYYAKRKKEGSPGLFKLLEADGGTPTPALWMDDTRTIRLSSLIQEKERKSWIISEFNGFFNALGWAITDKMVLYAFSYALRITKQPQYLLISEGVLSGRAHVILVYKIEKYILFVSDPNTPGNETRRVIYDENLDKFLYYTSSIKAGEKSNPYKNFIYLGGAALVSSRGVEKLWEMKNEKLGKGQFPDFTIKAYKNNEFIPFEDGFTTESGVIGVAVESTVPVHVQAMEGKYGWLIVNESFRRGNGNTTVTTTIFTIPGPGEYRLGIYVRDTITKHWAGFRWVNMKAEKQKDVPKPKHDYKPTSGELTIKATINGEEYDLQKSSFAIGDGNFRLDNSNPDLPYRLHFDIRNWHGEGEYNNVLSNWMSRRDKDIGDHIDRNGKMIITKWGEGKLEGTFTFKAYDDYYKTTVTGQGSFAYMAPGL